MHTRRQLTIGLAALSGAMSSGRLNAVAPRIGAPSVTGLSGIAAKMFQAVEDLPWIPSQGPDAYPVYVLYAPWCPFCRTLAEDLASGRLTLPNVQLRWIGCNPRTALNALLIADAVRRREFGAVIDAMLGKEPASKLPDEYIARCAASTAAAIYGVNEGSLVKRPTVKFPAFIYFTEGKVQTAFGYDTNRSETILAIRPTVMRRQSFIPRTYDALGDTWTFVSNVPGGKVNFFGTDYQIYSLPYEWSVPCRPLRFNKEFEATCFIQVRDQRWIELAEFYSIDRENHPAYILRA